MADYFYMASDFMICRNDGDRRLVSLDCPPYMSAEGMVMIDRRSQFDRRAMQVPLVKTAYDALRSDAIGS